MMIVKVNKKDTPEVIAVTGQYDPMALNGTIGMFGDLISIL